MKYEGNLSFSIHVGNKLFFCFCFSLCDVKFIDRHFANHYDSQTRAYLQCIKYFPVISMLIFIQSITYNNKFSTSWVNNTQLLVYLAYAPLQKGVSVV